MIINAYLWALLTFILGCVIAYTTGGTLPNSSLEATSVLLVYTIVFYFALKYTKTD